MKNRKGFTLLEILLVVAALAILAGIVILAINPTKQLGETRDAQRHSDVNAILNAIYQYSIDNDGFFPGSIDTDDTTVQVIGTAGSGCGYDVDEGVGCDDVEVDPDSPEDACANLGADTGDKGNFVPTYLTSIPIAPQTGASAANTQYYVNFTADERIEVGACVSEQTGSISVTR